MDYSSVFVCLMGMGTVFFGLICLIVLTTIMGRRRSCPGSRSRAPGEPAGAGGRRVRRHRGGAGHGHYRHPHPVYEETVMM